MENDNSVEASGFVKWLHRSYMQSSGVSRFVRRRITRIGFSLLGICIVSGAMAAGKPVPSLFQILAISSLTLFLSTLWALSRRATLEVQRHLPACGTVGQPVAYRVIITNTGKRRISDAWVMENTPDPRPSLASFASAREPGEEKRNAFDRLFRFYRWMWLIDQLESFDDSTSRTPINLLPGESQTITLTWTPKRRGIISLNEMRVLLPDPFGLFQRCRKINAPITRMVIYPEQHHLSNPPFSGLQGEDYGSDQSSRRLGSSDEFTSLRDYRPGDPIRQIHWRTWARTGQPVIKEYEETKTAQYSIFIDTFAHQAKNPQAFEHSLKIGSGLVSEKGLGSVNLSSIFTSETSLGLNAESEEEKTMQALTFLAGLSPSEASHNPEPKSLFLPGPHSVDQVHFLVCIFSHWDRERSAFVKKLARTEMKSHLIGIDLSERQLAQHPSDIPIQHVRLLKNET